MLLFPLKTTNFPKLLFNSNWSANINVLFEVTFECRVACRTNGDFTNKLHDIIFPDTKIICFAKVICQSGVISSSTCTSGSSWISLSLSIVQLMDEPLAIIPLLTKKSFKQAFCQKNTLVLHLPIIQKLLKNKCISKMRCKSLKKCCTAHCTFFDL